MYVPELSLKEELKRLTENWSSDFRFIELLNYAATTKTVTEMGKIDKMETEAETLMKIFENWNEIESGKLTLITETEQKISTA